jgi:hypothetical protein
MMTPPSPASPDPRIAAVLTEWQNEIAEHGVWTSGHSIGQQMAQLLTASEQARREAAQLVTALEAEKNALAYDKHELHAEQAAQDATITRLRKALQDLCDAIPDATIADDPPLGCWVDAALAALAAAPRPTPEGQD